MNRSLAQFMAVTTLWYMTISPRSYDPPQIRWVAASIALSEPACFLDRIYAHEWSSNPAVRSWRTECHSSNDLRFMDDGGLLVPKSQPEDFPLVMF
jgi:hypothetical protein